MTTRFCAENVYAHFSRRSLLSLAPRVTDIRVENFLLDVQLDLQTGRWNVGDLRFRGSGGGGGDLPTISLQRGKLRYCKVAGATQEVVMSVPIEAHFGRKPEAYPAYGFEIKTSKLSSGYGDSNLVGEWTMPVAGQAGKLTVAGGLSSADIPSLERAWAVDVLAAELTYGRDGSYTLKLRMKDVHGKQSPEVDMLRFITPAMVGESGPLRKLQEFFAEYQPTGTVGSIAIEAKGNTKNWQESEIEGNLVCKDISVCDSDFPYRIDHLSGELEFTQSSMRANRLVGKHGNVDVCMDGWVRETDGNRQYQYQLVSRNMVLDKALYAALDPEEKELWDAFQPTGVISVDYRVTRTSPTNRRLYLSVDLNDVNAAFRGFPYPLAGADRKSVLRSREHHDLRCRLPGGRPADPRERQGHGSVRRHTRLLPFRRGQRDSPGRHAAGCLAGAAPRVVPPLRSQRAGRHAGAGVQHVCRRGPGRPCAGTPRWSGCQWRRRPQRRRRASVFWPRSFAERVL